MLLPDRTTMSQTHTLLRLILNIRPPLLRFTIIPPRSNLNIHLPLRFSMTPRPTIISIPRPRLRFRTITLPLTILINIHLPLLRFNTTTLRPAIITLINTHLRPLRCHIITLPLNITIINILPRLLQALITEINLINTKLLPIKFILHLRPFNLIPHPTPHLILLVIPSRILSKSNIRAARKKNTHISSGLLPTNPTGLTATVPVPVPPTRLAPSGSPSTNPMPMRPFSGLPPDTLIRVPHLSQNITKPTLIIPLLLLPKLNGFSLWLATLLLSEFLIRSLRMLVTRNLGLILIIISRLLGYKSGHFVRQALAATLRIRNIYTGSAMAVVLKTALRVSR